MPLFCSSVCDNNWFVMKQKSTRRRGRPRRIHHMRDIKWTQKGLQGLNMVEWSCLQRLESHISSSGETLRLPLQPTCSQLDDELVEDMLNRLQAPLPLRPAHIHLTSLTWWILPGLPHLLLLICFCVSRSTQPEKQKTGPGNEARYLAHGMSLRRTGRRVERGTILWDRASEWRKRPWEADQQRSTLNLHYKIDVLWYTTKCTEL